MSAGPGDLVVDLTAVTFLDPAGLGMLARATRQLRERGGRLQLIDQARVVVGGS